jgi:hypothetical protein
MVEGLGRRITWSYSTLFCECFPFFFSLDAVEDERTSKGTHPVLGVDGEVKARLRLHPMSCYITVTDDDICRVA